MRVGARAIGHCTRRVAQSPSGAIDSLEGMTSTQGPADRRDDSLVEGSHPMSSYPAFPGKQVALGVGAVLLLVTMFLPWWDAEIPLDRVAETLNGWLLLVTGFSIGSLGVMTDYSWFGNVMFGLVPTLPLLALLVLLILRVLRVYVAPAKTLAMYAVFSVVGIVWLLLYAMLRIDASNGVYPILVGPWIVLIVDIALIVLCVLWWRTERIHFATRRRRSLRAQTASSADDASSPTDDLFRDIDDNETVEDAPLSMGDRLGVAGTAAGENEPNESDDDADDRPRRSDQRD